MNVSLTGTPGTGKTSIAKFLINNNIDVINLNEIISKNNFKCEIDEIRHTKIVEIDLLNKIIEKEINKNKILIIEGHLSHLLKYINKVIILRCNPNELKKRLLERRWNKNKINENIESEILDIILCECASLYSQDNIFEIDTTGNTIDNLSNTILDLIKNNFKENPIFKIGKIDWSEMIR